MKLREVKILIGKKKKSAEELQGKVMDTTHNIEE